jgi:hypothetical protein
MSLIIPSQLHSALIATDSPAPSPWSIDPERTQELVDATTPDETAWATTYSSRLISTDSPSPTPWSIDPERTQDLNA